MIEENRFRELIMRKIPLIEQRVINKELWIYGCGIGGTIVLNELLSSNISVAGFIDQRAKDVKMIDGYPVKK